MSYKFCILQTPPGNRNAKGVRNRASADDRAPTYMVVGRCNLGSQIPHSLAKIWFGRNVLYVEMEEVDNEWSRINWERITVGTVSAEWYEALCGSTDKEQEKQIKCLGQRFYNAMRHVNKGNLITQDKEAGSFWLYFCWLSTHLGSEIEITFASFKGRTDFISEQLTANGYMNKFFDSVTQHSTLGKEEEEKMSMLSELLDKQAISYEKKLSSEVSKIVSSGKQSKHDELFIIGPPLNKDRLKLLEEARGSMRKAVDEFGCHDKLHSKYLRAVDRIFQDFGIKRLVIDRCLVPNLKNKLFMDSFVAYISKHPYQKKSFPLSIARIPTLTTATASGSGSTHTSTKQPKREDTGLPQISKLSITGDQSTSGKKRSDHRRERSDAQVTAERPGTSHPTPSSSSNKPTSRTHGSGGHSSGDHSSGGHSSGGHRALEKLLKGKEKKTGDASKR